MQLHAAVRSPCSGSPLSVAIQQTTICGFPARSFQPPGMAVVSSPRIGTRMSTSLGIVLCHYLSGLPTWPTDGLHRRRGCVEQSAVCQSVLSLPALQPTTQFSQRGSCVLSHSLRNSGVRLAVCGLPDVARVLLPCHRIGVVAHRLRAVAGTHMSAARIQKTRAGRNLSDGSAV